jgi:Domain of unknown function (DUF4145)
MISAALLQFGFCPGSQLREVQLTIIGFVKPSFNQESFTCPHCNCYSLHEWRWIKAGTGGLESNYSWVTSWCLHCSKYCLWQKEKLVWPIKSGLADPIDGCPEPIKAIYEEAREIFPSSPRASAALLRLAVQLVCVEKGLPGKDLNSDVGSLVKSGLPVQIQQSLDLLRVVGNNAVHPGQIVIEDNREHIEKFFGLVNLIVDVLIIQPAKVHSMFTTLVPPNQQQKIAARDAKA